MTPNEVGSLCVGIIVVLTIIFGLYIRHHANRLTNKLGVGWKSAELEYDSLSPEDRHETEQQTQRFIQGFLPNNTLTENGVTVSYSLDPLKAFFTDPEKWQQKKRTIESKVRDILHHSHDPQADLNLHASALGISNISVSVKPTPPPPVYHAESSTRRHGIIGSDKK